MGTAHAYLIVAIMLEVVGTSFLALSQFGSPLCFFTHISVNYSKNENRISSSVTYAACFSAACTRERVGRKSHFGF